MKTRLKYPFGIFLVILSLLTVNIPVQATFDLKNYRELTVLIENVGEGRGTGIMLDNTHVLTCFHLAKTPKDDFFVYTYPLGRVIEAKIEFLKPGDDLMILTLKEPVKVESTPVFERHVEIGEPIVVVGNALGIMEWFVSKGSISGVRNEFLLSDALVNPGNSGGPWFNEDGHIVGMTDWRIGPAQHVPGFSGAIPGSVIDEFLDQWGRAKDEQAMRKMLGGL